MTEKLANQASIVEKAKKASLFIFKNWKIFSISTASFTAVLIGLYYYNDYLLLKEQTSNSAKEERAKNAILSKENKADTLETLDKEKLDIKNQIQNTIEEIDVALKNKEITEPDSTEEKNDTETVSDFTLINQKTQDALNKSKKLLSDLESRISQLNTQKDMSVYLPFTLNLLKINNLISQGNITRENLLALVFASSFDNYLLEISNKILATAESTKGDAYFALNYNKFIRKISFIKRNSQHTYYNKILAFLSHYFIVIKNSSNTKAEPDEKGNAPIETEGGSILKAEAFIYHHDYIQANDVLKSFLDQKEADDSQEPETNSFAKEYLKHINSRAEIQKLNLQIYMYLNSLLLKNHPTRKPVKMQKK